jgi:hypothetical protein
VLVVAAVLLLGGCDRLAGPCSHTYREPILQLGSARDSLTNAPLPRVVLHEVRQNGRTLDLGFLLAAPGFGVAVQGDSALCDLPCGFAVEEAQYRLTVSAPDYPRQARTYTARYRVFQGGCPSFNDGGVRVSLALQRP